MLRNFKFSFFHFCVPWATCLDCSDLACFGWTVQWKHSRQSPRKNDFLYFYANITVLSIFQEKYIISFILEESNNENIIFAIEKYSKYPNTGQPKSWFFWIPDILVSSIQIVKAYDYLKESLCVMRLLSGQVTFTWCGYKAYEWFKFELNYLYLLVDFDVTTRSQLETLFYTISLKTILIKCIAGIQSTPRRVQHKLWTKPPQLDDIVELSFKLHYYDKAKIQQPVLNIKLLPGWNSPTLKLYYLSF